LTTNAGSTTTYFIGNYYEITGSEITKYYYAGSQRVAMRKNGNLNFILTDHLGSTSLVTDANGTVINETKYKAWGELRYSSGTNPTDYTYTGQYSYTDDFGLMFYNARWYDSSLSRFAQADTIVPLQTQGVQAWDRYAYANNNPVSYTDPTGHNIDPFYFNLSSFINSAINVLSLGNLSGEDVTHALDSTSTALDGVALAIDSAVATGDIVAGTIGYTAGAGVGALGGGVPTVVTGPAGALVGIGLFELNPLVRGAQFTGNALATISTGLTAISDVVSGETNYEVGLSISETSFEYNSYFVIGRDTVTSTALTGAGWASPIGLTSVPLQGAAFLNDIGMLYSLPIPIIDKLPKPPISIPVSSKKIKINWE
jgi:RHS repeat-associated protein